MQPLSKSRNQLYPAECDCRGQQAKRYAKWIPRFLTALIDRNIVAGIVSMVKLPGPGDFLLGIQKHLFPLCDPPPSPRKPEKHTEHSVGEAPLLVNKARIEKHVGVEFGIHKIKVFQ